MISGVLEHPWIPWHVFGVTERTDRPRHVGYWGKLAVFDVRVKLKLKLSYLNADAIESECDSVIRCSDIPQYFNLEGALVPPSSVHLAPPPAYPSPPPSLFLSFPFCRINPTVNLRFCEGL